MEGKLSYSALVSKGAKLAFKAAKDLAKDVVYVKKTGGTDFNFITGEATTPQTSTQIVVKTVEISQAKLSRDKKTYSKQVMFKTDDVGDIKSIDHVLIDSEKWNIGPEIHGDRAVTIVELTKGA